MKPTQLAKILNVSPAAIYHLIRKGKIKVKITKKIEKNTFEIPEDEVERLKKKVIGKS